MTLNYILVGYRDKETILDSVLHSSLIAANKAGNCCIEYHTIEHFTVIPVAIPDEDDLSLM